MVTQHILQVVQINFALSENILGNLKRSKHFQPWPPAQLDRWGCWPLTAAWSPESQESRVGSTNTQMKYKYTNTQMKYKYTNTCIHTNMLLFLIDEWAVSHQENHKTREYCVEIFLKV